MRIGDQEVDDIIVDRGHLQESGTCQVWRQRDCRESREMARSGLYRAVCGNTREEWASGRMWRSGFGWRCLAYNISEYFNILKEVGGH